MPSPNRVVLACAGSGKTTSIARDACGDAGRRSALITYTINGAGELTKAAYAAHAGSVPSHITISTWYAFLLRHFVRPYQNHLYAPRIARINFIRGQSARFIKASDIRRHYFSREGVIYLDKVSKFACEAIKRTKGLPIRRFERIFDRLYIDESQDLQGFDLDLVELLLQCGTEIVLVGDHRQATYSTNDSRKNKKFARANIVDKFTEWAKRGLCKIEYQTESRRCVQAICDLADQFYPSFPKTTSRNHDVTGHDGVFAVEQSHVDTYFARFAPQTLRYNRTHTGIPGMPINFGNAKGMTFYRTLIFPHGPLSKFLKSGDIVDAGAEIPKLYVAITRARQSVAFVVPDGFPVKAIPLYRPNTA
ncbi:AAA family ATPase [Bradyrhizobium sp. KB893862 SZCCT0404]|uniref:UvrD-helicase domain-containing protein n=1 Tax=Bradyrhizobium sp. KB893862 SZCCT0404 TaxID=2807672 RepID=UPI001BAAE1BA|nr:UvrD-helicase domain-containing protein [Bradyrhizobium sp. KB893862 SZCCT0404]MBR1177084.1 AAA family ATPase [Bradyrhizobium sp. KB893862 SZCCT0404]